jgi:hypothetical protein
MAESGNGRTGVVGKVRGKLDKRRERRTEKARVKAEVQREHDRSGKGGHAMKGYGAGPGAGGY